MKKFFSISNNQALVFISFLSVIILIAIYLFVYIPQNEMELKEQRFRSMQRIADNVHQKINNSISLMDGLLKASFDKSTTSSKVSEYIKAYDTKNFTLSPVVGAIDTTIIKKAKQKNVSPIFSDAEDGTSAIKVNEATRKFKLYYAKRFPKGTRSDSAYYMSMLYNFEDFIKPLLPLNVFDAYVVFSKGNVVYESFPSGLSYTNKDSLLGVRNAVAGSAIRDQDISGIKYKFFLQPVGFDSTNEWIVGGLLRNDRYNAEKKQLPANFVLALVVIAIVIIILLPWIKLFLMGSRDRLTLQDGGLSFFVAMLLTSMLFFIALKSSTWFHKTGATDSEKNLAVNIENAFHEEITKAYNEIKSFDTLRCSYLLNASIINLEKYNEKAAFIKLYSTQKKQSQKHIQKVKDLLDNNLSINQVFWLDDKGHDTYTWVKDKWYAPPGDFSRRKYYKNIAEKKYLFLQGDISKPFYIEPVVSWTTATFRTVISIPSTMKDEKVNPEAVAAISVNIKSLDSVSLPAGCQFAITDDKGSVLYHYHPGRNLNENLLDEFSEKDELKGAYESHTTKKFSTDYYSRQYDVYVTPIKGLPYFLLVLTDKVYEDTSNIEIFGITLSLTFIFFLFQFLLIILIVITIIFSKKSTLKNWYLAASWLWPKRSVHEEYVVSIFYNLLIIILQIFFFTKASFAENCFMLLPAVSFVTICFNALLAKRYYYEGKFKYYSIKKRVIIFIGLLILLINFFADSILNILCGCFMLFQLVAIALLILVVAFKKHILQFIQFITSFISMRWDYVNSYALLAFTYCVIASGIPVCLFYVSSFNYEQNLMARYKQVEFAKQVIRKDPHLTNPANIKSVYKDSVWIKDYSVSTGIPAVTGYTKEDTSSLKLLNKFRFYANDVSTGSQDLNAINSSDSVYFFGNIFNHACKPSPNASNIYGDSLCVTSIRTPEGKYLNITSPLITYYSTHTLSVFKLILLMFVFILFYLLIYKIIRKMFALDLPGIEKWNELDSTILNSAKLNDHILVIGAPGSGKLSSLKEKIISGKIELDGEGKVIYDAKNSANNNFYIADLINIPAPDNKDADAKKPDWSFATLFSTDIDKKSSGGWKEVKEEAKKERYKLVIIDHFGYNMNHEKTNREKLNFLEELMVEDQNKEGQHKKIIILSTVHPYIFLDSLAAQQSNENNSTDYDLQRWIEVLGHFRIIIYPIQQTNPIGKLEKLMASIDELKAIHSTPNTISGLPEEKILVEKLEYALSAAKNFMQQSISNNSLLNATSYYEELKGKAQPVVEDIEDFLKTNPPYSLLLEHPKEILKEILIYAKEKSNESGQKVLRETMHTHFLNKLQRPLGELRNDKNINSDALSLKMQLTSQHYYMYIWNSLTKEEKFLLYDLAEDGLVNTHDIFNLTMLISKGLIQRDKDDTLKVFNKSFRNFITNSIGYTESRKIRQDIEENGSWNKLKTPLVIVSIAILALVIISQHEAYTKVVGYLTVLVTAVIPFLQKVFGFFEKGKSKN